MTTTTPYSLLEAVNEMLMGIGQAPVNTLAGVAGDPLIAQTILGTVTRYVLLYGFAFNTDQGYVLTPDMAGKLLVPTGALRINPSDTTLLLVPRKNTDGNMAVYDKANQTFVFPQPPAGSPYKFDIVWGFDFESLPETAKNYIAVSSVRRFQRRMIGSNELDAYNAADEQQAWSLLLREERLARDTNQFRRNPALQRWMDRTGAIAAPYAGSYGGPVTD